MMNACSLPQYIKLYLNIHRILDIVILLTSGLTGLVDFMNPRRKSFNHSHLYCSLPLSLWLPLRLCVSFPPQSLEITLKYCNYFFTSTFVLESILKLIAFGFRRFFKERYSVHSPSHFSSHHVSSPPIAN